MSFLLAKYFASIVWQGCIVWQDFSLRDSTIKSFQNWKVTFMPEITHTGILFFFKVHKVVYWVTNLSNCCLRWSPQLASWVAAHHSPLVFVLGPTLGCTGTHKSNYWIKIQNRDRTCIQQVPNYMLSYIGTNGLNFSFKLSSQVGNWFREMEGGQKGRL